MWALVFIPMIIAATLAITRWYQITYPIRFVNRKVVEIPLAVSCLCFLIYFQRFSLVNSSENPVVLKMNMQIVTHFKLDSFVDRLPFVLVLLFTSISNLASALTMWMIFKSQSIQGSVQRRPNRTKSTVKIAILNAGNLLWNGLVFFRIFTSYKSKTMYIIQTVLCVQPIIQSTYNPVVFVLLTKNIFNNFSRVRAVNRT